MTYFCLLLLQERQSNHCGAGRRFRRNCNMMEIKKRRDPWKLITWKIAAAKTTQSLAQKWKGSLLMPKLSTITLSVLCANSKCMIRHPNAFIKSAKKRALTVFELSAVNFHARCVSSRNSFCKGVSRGLKFTASSNNNKSDAQVFISRFLSMLFILA